LSRRQYTCVRHPAQFAQQARKGRTLADR
jgi:hypothetical protein